MVIFFGVILIPIGYMNSGIFFAPKNTRTKRPMRRISWNPTPCKNKNVAFMAINFRIVTSKIEEK